MPDWSVSIRVMRDDVPVRGARVEISLRSITTITGYTENDGWVELEEDMNDDDNDCYITINGEYMGMQNLNNGDTLSFSID